MNVINASNLTNVNASAQVKALQNKAPAKNQQAASARQNGIPVSPEKHVQRIENNAKAIDLLEQQSASKNEQKAQLNANTVKLDQPSAQNLTAVYTYQSVNNLTQKEHIQALLGVDLFA